MRKLLSWRVLFGFLVIFTIIIVSLMLFSILQERSRVHKIVRELIGSVKNVDSTNNAMDVIIDSLANRLNYLSSQVTMLEAQKDSLLGKPGQSKGHALRRRVQTGVENPTPLRRPVFTIVDRNGKAIGKDGISADSLIGMKVMSGTGYSVRRMDAVLGRGTARVQEITGVSGNYDWRMWNSQCVVGDRIVISIKKVVRLITDGKEENVDVGTVLLTVPIRATKQPYLLITENNGTGKVIGPDGIDADLIGFVVMARSGYRIENMEITLSRGTSRIMTMTVKSEIVDLRDWIPSMRSGDRIIVDVKKIVLPGSTSSKKTFKGEIISIPIR